MLKIFAFLMFLVAYATAQDKVEIYATALEFQDDIVKASNKVIVVYGEYFLSAQRAVYNKQTGDLELFENIRANYSGQYKVLGSYAKLNIAKKERAFAPFYMLEKQSQTWISGDSGQAKENELEIIAGITSGCNPSDPLWKIEFSSSNYNTESKWLNLYNARLYLYDIPVLYTPYFGYSLDTTRRTGLLLPTFGISGYEGFYYEQPFYIAEQSWWDAELRPQVRTIRGSGLYGEFRFVDSEVSKGKFVAGYFKEQEAYAQKNELIYNKHYGFNFEYENTDVINQWFGLNDDAQTGLYVDINNMNDVDYLNLSSNDTTRTFTATQVLSRMNGFYNTDTNYFATYFKYYKDLTLQSNKNTLQKLPTMHYHRYLSTLLQNHLFYNVNIQSSNIYREINKKAVQTNIDFPITLQTSLFDEYLNLSYTSQLYAQHSKFSGSEDVKTGEYENGYFIRNHHIFRASTQLTKAFEDMTHVIGFGAELSSKGDEGRDGYYEDYESFCSLKENVILPQCEFYNITDVQEVVKLDFKQYFYDTSSTQRIYHRLAQNMNYKDTTNEFGELENELDFQITDTLNYYNNLYYNYDETAFSKIFNQFSYNDSSWHLSLSHLYRNSFLKKTLTYTPFTSYITSTARYTYNNHYSYMASINYDYENKEKKSAEIGFMYKKRCWDFGLRYVENTRPVLRTGEQSSIYDRYLYVSVVLKPFMSSGGASNFAIRLPDKLQGN